MEAGNFIPPWLSLVVPSRNNVPFTFAQFNPLQRPLRQRGVWRQPFQHLADLRVKIRLHAMVVLEFSAESAGYILHFDVLLQRGQNLGGLQDVQFLDSVRIDPSFDPPPDSWEEGRCPNDLVYGR